jgi:hypothetical protein
MWDRPLANGVARPVDASHSGAASRGSPELKVACPISFSALKKQGVRSEPRRPCYGLWPAPVRRDQKKISLRRLCIACVSHRGG